MSFKTIVINSGAHFIVTLQDESNGAFAEIFSFGALLNEFSAVNDQESINVIEGFTDLEDAKNTLTEFFKSTKLSPYACRVKNSEYTFGEKHYQLSKHFSKQDAIHGLLFDAPFTIKERQSDDNSASVVLEYVYDDNNEGFPFCYQCEVEYKLTVNNTLAIITAITNLDDKLMPVVDGWHPYFTLGGNINTCQLEFQSKEMLEFKDLIPTGKLIPFEEFSSLKYLETTELDNCFTVNFAECQPLCVLRNPAKKVQVEIYPSPSYPFLQIYTPPHRHSIAIENLSAAPDALNNAIGLKVLEPKQTAVFSTKYAIRFL